MTDDIIDRFVINYLKIKISVKLILVIKNVIYIFLKNILYN